MGAGLNMDLSVFTVGAYAGLHRGDTSGILKKPYWDLWGLLLYTGEMRKELTFPLYLVL